MALLSSFVLFIKGIRICKCNKGGFEIERDVNYDIEQQQEYTLKLIKALKNSYTPRKEWTRSPSNYDKEFSEVSRDVNCDNEYEKNIKYINIEGTGDKDISELISDLEQEIENNKKNRKINHKKQNSREYIESKILKITGLYKKSKTEVMHPNIIITDPKITCMAKIESSQDENKEKSKNITQFISKKIK